MVFNYSKEIKKTEELLNSEFFQNYTEEEKDLTRKIMIENLKKKQEEVLKMVKTIKELEKQFKSINENENLSLMVKFDLLKNVQAKINKLKRNLDV